MKHYTPDKPTVDAWILNGGAEIVLEVIRRMDWTVEVLTGDDWEWLPEIVVTADRVRKTIYINGEKSPYLQAMFAAMVVENVSADNDEPYKDLDDSIYRWKYPVIREHDKFRKCSISIVTRFCDEIRLSSEATVSLIGKGLQT